MAQLKPFIKETTATTGTGLSLTLTEVTGFARFLSAETFAADAEVQYTVRNGNNFEWGLGTNRAGNILDRTTPIVTLVAGVPDASSPSRIDLVGTSDVYCDIGGPASATQDGFLTKEALTAFIGKEDAGVAASLDAAHVADVDPHPQYATDADVSAKIEGSGTTNTIPKFTPDGSTLGDSSRTDTGAIVTESLSMVFSNAGADSLSITFDSGGASDYKIFTDETFASRSDFKIQKSLADLFMVGNASTGDGTVGIGLDVGANANGAINMISSSGATKNFQFRINGSNIFLVRSDGVLIATSEIRAGGTQYTEPSIAFNSTFVSLSQLAGGTLQVGRAGLTNFIRLNGTVLGDSGADADFGSTIVLKAGSTTLEPLQFRSGALLTTAVAGAMEFLTDAFYGTITTGAARKTFAFLESPTFTGTVSAPTIVSTTMLRLKGYTVATLPAGTQGDTAFVTDALAPVFLAAVVGGGAVVSPVFYDGTNWVVA